MPAEPEKPEAPKEEPKSNNMGGLVVFLLVALSCGDAALYYFKFRKPPADTTGSDNLDEYDFGDDEDDEPAGEPNEDMRKEDEEKRTEASAELLSLGLRTRVGTLAVP